MRWILFSVYWATGVLFISIVLAVVFVEQIRPFIDVYANPASVLGLLVSIIGFALTVWTVFETLRVSTRAREEAQKAIADTRKETRDLLQKIQRQLMGETIGHAFLYATEARHSIRSGDWLRTVERCDDARQFSARLLAFVGLSQDEERRIRAIIEDLRTTAGFIQRNRLGKTVASDLPGEISSPVAKLIDELEAIRTRFQQQLLEISDVN